LFKEGYYFYIMKINIKISFALLLLCFAGAGLFLFLNAGGDTAVYVTNSGKKYHRDSCSSLSRSKIAIPLEDAVSSGYEPCGICKPPALAPAPAAIGKAATGTANGALGGAANGETAGLYRVNLAGLKTSAGADIRRMVQAEVVGHVDGDTVRVRISNPPEGLQAVETIRMLGVDTPETVHPSRPVERFGREASDFTKERLLNKTVRLAFDWDLRDRYGRLLAYIYTGDAACFNAALIREGYAHAYTSFAFQFADEFRALEREARLAERGLWQE
jgi:micrococcal nuclease